jgi:hypothetical protein
VRPHPGERLRYAIHRPRAQRFVAGQLEPAGLSGQHAGQQPHQRPGVRAVDRLVRRLEATEPDPVNQELVSRDLLDLDG